MAATATEPGVGALLRGWRERRRCSQLELAGEAGVSARHISFIETGRARPSRAMVVSLCEGLGVPLRERNRVLLAAGYAPVYRELAYEAPEMAPVREAIEKILAGHEPYPAIVVDRHWELVAGNRGVAMLTAGAAPELLEPPVNAMRLALHPDGLAPRIVNFAEWRAHLLERLERQQELTGDLAVGALLEELRGYPGGDPDYVHEPSGHDLFIPLRMRGEQGELSFFSTVATFGTAVDVTVAELSIESFFPADAATAAAISLPDG